MSVAGYTFKGMQDEVLQFQFSETKYRPLVKTWLNQGVRKAVIQSEIRTQESRQAYSTAIGATSLALPENFSRLIDFADPETDQLLMPMDLRDYDTMVESSGRPTAYTVAGSEILLYPTPDAVYPLALRYWRLPADMVKDEDTPELPVQYQELPIAYAMRKAFLREDDFTAAKEWEAEWTNGLMKMRGEVQADVFDGPRQVQGSWGDPHGQPSIGFWR